MLNSTVVGVCWDIHTRLKLYLLSVDMRTIQSATWHALLTRENKYILCLTCRKCIFSWTRFKPYGLFFFFFAESCFSVCGWPKAPGFICLFPARCRFLNWETCLQLRFLSSGSGSWNLPAWVGKYLDQEKKVGQAFSRCLLVSRHRFALNLHPALVYLLMERQVIFLSGCFSVKKSYNPIWYKKKREGFKVLSGQGTLKLN